jgi:hypothetical protein
MIIQEYLVHLIVFISKCHQLLCHSDYFQELTFLKIKYILYLKVGIHTLLDHMI